MAINQGRNGPSDPNKRALLGQPPRHYQGSNRFLCVLWQKVVTQAVR